MLKTDNKVFLIFECHGKGPFVSQSRNNKKNRMNMFVILLLLFFLHSGVSKRATQVTRLCSITKVSRSRS